MAISFLIGFVIERGIIRWVEGASPLTLLIVTLGLLSIINERRRLALGLPAQGGRVAVPDRARSGSAPRTTRSSSAGRPSASCIVLIVVMAAIFGMFNCTKLGLGLRGAAGNPRLGEARRHRRRPHAGDGLGARRPGRRVRPA